MNAQSILLFSHETTLSGAPLALFYLADWLNIHGAHPVVATPEHGPISDQLQERGIETIIDETFLTDPQRRSLESVCARFSIVIANTLASWPIVRAARRVDRCAIWYLHETAVAFALARKIPEILPAFDDAELLIAPTETTAQLYRSITRTPVEVVPYGIPEQPITPGEIAGSTRRFLCLGSYEPRKGQDVLLAAIAQLSPEISRLTNFHFAGRALDEDFFAGLQTSASALANVTLGPALDHDESLRLLGEMDAFICPSRDETMPLAMIEAMSLGKNILSANVGGIFEWLRPGLNGWLVAPNDSTAMAHAISDCVAHRARAALLAASARRTFERHFSLKKFGDNFRRAIERVEGRKLRGEEFPPATYEHWLRSFDSPSERERVALRRNVRELLQHPLFSIVLPVYNPDLKFLAAAIGSVQGQSYESWELCIADDASTDSEVKPFLERVAATDSHIKLTFRLTNGHISAASNSALALATGDWCALLDQDDELAEYALTHVAREIAQQPDARLIYSDEDKIDLGGRRTNPFFKPDWNPELFCGQNFINHLGVYATDLLREIGGFREGYEGSQDYDLALRCIDRLRSEQIRHIPRILYHWRAAPGSLAELPDAKPYAREAARRSLGDHLQRRGIRGRVEACPENDESHRVIYDLTEPPPLVSVIIPLRDRVGLLKTCLESLRRLTNYSPYEILLVDNDSRETETREYLDELQQNGAAQILRGPGVFNFSCLNNRAAAEARGDILAFLNNDVEIIEPDWLGEMVSHAARAEVGAVGARLWYRDGTLQHGGVILGLGGVAGHAFHRLPRGHPGYFNRTWLQQNCGAVTAACLLTRKKIFDLLGGFNEREFAINFNDIEYCLRLAARGLQVVWTPYANLRHEESGSRGHHRSVAEQAQFFHEATAMQERYGHELLHGKFYNPNLSLDLPGYELALPPRRDFFA